MAMESDRGTSVRAKSDQFFPRSGTVSEQREGKLRKQLRKQVHGVNVHQCALPFDLDYLEILFPHLRRFVSDNLAEQQSV